VVDLNEEGSILQDVLGKDQPKIPIFAFYISIVVMLCYHATSFHILDSKMIEDRYLVDQYSVTFAEEQYSVTDQEFAQDSSIYIEYEADDNLFSSHTGFGYLLVTVSYDETSGIPLDQCDSVSVNIPPTGATADWQNQNNTLSGASDDCSDIELIVFVYPGYTGEEYTEDNDDMQGIIEHWTEKSHGQGTFTIEIDVSSSSPAPPPSPQDNGEEVTVTWTAVFFDVDAVLQPLLA
tara:strand:- start:319 stop:1023 length:705 start_codon:yes stop_codon:yes gene_type:complete